ncbi:MAG: hypothetical protein K5640_07430 [Treponema sp.]|nr:hypothetical protein [Treponema sp.]
MLEKEKLEKIADILNSQNVLMDEILAAQVKIRAAVMNKDWVNLQNCIETIQKKTRVFVELDKVREELSLTVPSEKLSENEAVTSELRYKLIKSEVENKALGSYLKIVKGFVQGVIDSVVPQRRNTLYSRKGRIIRPQPESIVVNQLF